MTNIVDIESRRKPKPTWEKLLEAHLDEAASCIVDRVLGELKHPANPGRQYDRLVQIVKMKLVISL